MGQGMETGGEQVEKGARAVGEWGSLRGTGAGHTLGWFGGWNNHWVSDQRNQFLRFESCWVQGSRAYGQSLNKQDYSRK